MHFNIAPSSTRFFSLIFVLLFTFMLLTPTAPNATEMNAAEIDQESRASLAKLYENVPAAKVVSEKAYAILIFPSVYKAGLLLGGQYGEGALIKDGKTLGYYTTAGASWGLQAGAQKFGYALFLMNKGAVDALDDAEGFEVGVGPSIVFMDDENAYAKNMTTTTLQEDVYAFISDQKGLMAGLGIQGNKITKVQPD